MPSVATTAPSMAQIRGLASTKALCEQIKQAMAEAGMPRTSNYSGGEVMGLIKPNHYGSTGFSVAIRSGSSHDHIKRPHLDFHVVLSGKAAGLAYMDTYHRGEIDGHRPVNPGSLCWPIQQLFERLGFQVIEVRDAGYQTVWDDDCCYSVYCELPA